MKLSRVCGVRWRSGKDLKRRRSLSPHLKLDAIYSAMIVEKGEAAEGQASIILLTLFALRISGHALEDCPYAAAIF